MTSKRLRQKIEEIPMNSDFFNVKTKNKFFQQTIPDIHRIMLRIRNEHRKIADRLTNAISYARAKQLNAQKYGTGNNSYNVKNIKDINEVLENRRFHSLFNFTPKEFDNISRSVTLENLFKKSNTLEQKLNILSIIQKYKNYKSMGLVVNLIT